jgi:hypothetical protein
MSQATTVSHRTADRLVAFTVMVAGVFLAGVVAYAVLDVRGGGESAPPAVSAPAPPPGPAGVITYQIPGQGFYVAKASGEPLGVASEHDIHGVHDASATDEVSSPDGKDSARIDRNPTGVWLAVGAPGAEASIAQLAGPSDPALVAGGKGAAREVEGIPLVVAWSPDSERLAYGSITGEPWSLNVYNGHGSVPEFQRHQVTGGYVGELAWSPDGQYLAISTYAVDRTSHTVLLLDTRTNRMERLSDGCHLTWSPDSKYLAIHRDPGVESGAWVLSVDGDTRFLSAPIRAHTPTPGARDRKNA